MTGVVSVKIDNTADRRSDHPVASRWVQSVPVENLRPADSPRLDGVDSNHVLALAEILRELPPILVHRATMRVIDGMHRLAAAELCGRTDMDVVFFDGSAEDAFRMSVEANVCHGLPLTVADRRAAAERLIRSHPQLSDRAVSSVAGLAAKTVAAIRGKTETCAQSTRLGRDGRVRPLDAAKGRRLAGEALAAHPDMSLRELARHAGIALGTARDVRERVRAGDDPVLPKQRRLAAPAEKSVVTARVPTDSVDVTTVLEGLRRDPSLRYSERGRTVLRWLNTRVIGPAEWRQAMGCVSPHNAILIGRLARECAKEWVEFAEELERTIADG